MNIIRCILTNYHKIYRTIVIIKLNVNDFSLVFKANFNIFQIEKILHKNKKNEL